MSDDKTLQDFVSGANFSAPLLAEIFKDIVSKYPAETKRQHAIRATVELFQNKYKPEMRMTQRAINEAREKAANEHVADIEHDTRFLFRVPETLVARIQAVIDGPDFLSNEAQEQFGEINWFAKEFPQFRVPEKY